MSGRIGRWILVAFLVAAALSATMTAAIGASSHAVPSLFNAALKERVAQQHLIRERETTARIHRRLEIRQRRLQQPEARAQRRESRTAFHSMPLPAARKLLMRHYDEVLDGMSANPAATLKETGSIVRYVNDHNAQVETPEGMQLVTSTAPLRVADGSGEKRPVDLRLTESLGVFRPIRPLNPTSIGAGSKPSVTVGPAAITITMLGAGGDAALINGDQSAFYGEVAADTDAVAAPKLGGADLSAQLRSRTSPQELRYRVSLPPRADLFSVGGGAVVVRQSTVLARIPAPSSRDAQGTLVPTRMTVEGDQLVVYADHRERSYAYPILVDPEVVLDLTESSEGWEFYYESADPFYCEGKGIEISFSGCPSNGMLIGDGPGGGAPVTVLMGSIEVPFVESRYNPYMEKEEEVEIFAANGYQWWWPDSSTEISSVKFEGVSASGALGPNVVTSFLLRGCGQFYEWYANEASPASVLFSPKEIRTCHNLEPFLLEPILIGMRGYSGLRHERESKPPHRFIQPIGEHVTLSGYISVAAVLVTRPLGSVEAEELNSEDFGAGNPAELDSSDCMAGDPVDCQSGNLVETQQDLAVGGSGPGLELVRTYNSQLAATQEEPGRFGFGWTDSYSEKIETRFYCVANCKEASRREGEGEEGVEEFEEFATVHHDNGSTAEFHRPLGEEGPWAAVSPRTKSKLESEAEEEGYVYTLPAQSVLRFDSEGLLASEEDRNGNTVTLHRNGEGRLESVSDDAGRELIFTYDFDGFVASVEDPMENVVQYHYEGKELVGVTMPGEEGWHWEFQYDPAHELTKLTNGRGEATRTMYNALKVVRQQDPAERNMYWDYETTETGSKTTITEVNGSETVQEFNEAGQVTSVTRAAGTALAATTSYEYDEEGQLVGVTDPSERTTEYTYDVDGNRTTAVDPGGSEWKWTYNATHDVLSSTTPGGEKTTIVRDENGNPETISKPAPGAATQTSSFDYDARGLLEIMTDPLGREWISDYNAAGDKITEENPAGDLRTWVYNENSQLISTVSARGNEEGSSPADFTTSFELDPQGRVVQVTDALERKWGFEYDGNGNLEREIDPNEHETRYFRNAADELVKVETASGNDTEMEYDEAGQLAYLYDADERKTSYAYDSFGRITEVTDPLGRTTMRVYDAAGRLEQVTDPDERETSFDYDEAGRLEEITYSDETTPSVEYGYDADGRIIEINDGTGESEFDYDQLGRLVRSEDGGGNEVEYEYDIGNQQTGITYPNGKQVTRTFDEAGRLEGIEDWLGNETLFDYNADSAHTETTFPSSTGEVDTYNYDRTGLVSTVEFTQGEEALASIEYSRGLTGLIEGTITNGLPGPEEQNYVYNQDNRLVEAGGAPYEYDGVGDLVKSPGGEYVYDAAGQLESGAGVTYQYDKLGRRIEADPSSGPVTSYEFDQAGRLTAVARPEEGEVAEIDASYLYDGLGRRVSQTTSAGSSDLTWDASASPEPILSDGKASYIYGPGGKVVEQVSTSEAPTFYHHDHLGSTRMLTDASGEPTATFSYAPYGAPAGSTGMQTTPLGYAGQYTDAETGLQYLRARYYDPATGQFLSRDPQSSLTGSLYAYVAGNPLNATDPSGMSLVDDALGAAGEFVESLNPIKYYEEEIEAIENGCSYWESITHGLEGALVGATDATGIGALVRGAAGLLAKRVSGEIAGVLAGLAAGRSPGVLVASGEAELSQIYARLAAGGTPIDFVKGAAVKLADGTRVQWRRTSGTGGPAIDIFPSGGGRIKIHVD